jgi:hypothetical protein
MIIEMIWSKTIKKQRKLSRLFEVGTQKGLPLKIKDSLRHWHSLRPIWGVMRPSMGHQQFSRVTLGATLWKIVRFQGLPLVHCKRWTWKRKYANGIKFAMISRCSIQCEARFKKRMIFKNVKTGIENFSLIQLKQIFFLEWSYVL